MRTTAVYLGDYTAIALTQLGQKIYVDTRDRGIAPHLLLDGMWESWITQYLRPFLRDSVFVDVGANFGWYTLLAHKEGAAEILAFEPNDRVRECLDATISVNGIEKIHLFSVPLSEREEMVNFFSDERWPGNGNCVVSAAQDPNKRVAFILTDKRETINRKQTRTLDDVVKGLWFANDDTPVVLKIDVETFEPRVVLGAQEVLKRQGTSAVVEFHSDPDGKNKLVEMLDLLESLKYQMGHIQRDGKSVPITRAGLDRLPDAEMLTFVRF